MSEIIDSNNSLLNSTITRIGRIVFCGFVIGYLVPLIICNIPALSGGGANRLQVLRILTSKEYQEKNKNDIRSLQKINMLASAIRYNAAVNRKIDSVERTGLDPFVYKKTYLNQLDSSKIDVKKINIKIQGFMESKNSLMWPVSLTALWIIYFILLPVKPKRNHTHFLMTFLLVGIVYISFPVLRAFLTTWQYGRIIYSVYSYDINPVMYFYNLLLDLIVIAFIVLIWQKCDCMIKKNAKEHFSEFTLEGIINTLDTIKRNYNIWQFFSIGLFAVFGLLLYNLYSYAFMDGDKRFLFQGVFYNFIYLFTWLVGTIPLYLEFETWRSFKDKVMFDKFTNDIMEKNGVDTENLRKIIPEYEVASSLNHAVTIILSGLSFFLPLFKALHW